MTSLVCPWSVVNSRPAAMSQSLMVRSLAAVAEGRAIGGEGHIVHRRLMAARTLSSVWVTVSQSVTFESSLPPARKRRPARRQTVDNPAVGT